MEAPTSFLPPLKRLDEYTGPQIHKILTRLVTIYLPKVRGTAVIEEDEELLQSDEFERSFAIRWLTGFIARGEEWSELFTDEEDFRDGAPATNLDSSIGRFQTDFSDDTYLARTTAYDRAAALLGACAGTSASGVISRELKFATSLSSVTDGLACPEEITVMLRDESISTGDHTAVGLQTWGSACILAERIACDPVAFGLPDSSNSSSGPTGARILELGAGTGLLSLLAGKLVERATGNDPSNYEIIATDYHPAVLANLRANVDGNFPDSNAENSSLIDVQPLDWSLYLTGEPTTELSRAPSVAPTPVVGTPVSGSGQIGIEPTTSVTSPSALGTLPSDLTVSPSVQTPSFSITSSVSTPTTSHSPQTPQTPKTARSPPPNLARAVFSRLIARGLKFEMPGGTPGMDQNAEQFKKCDSQNLDDDLTAHNFGSVPITIIPDPFIPSSCSDVPTAESDKVIETMGSSPSRVSSPRSLSPSRCELLCAHLQDTTIAPSANYTGSNHLPSCLDSIDMHCCSDNTGMTTNTDGDQRLASPRSLVPDTQAVLIGDMPGSTCSKTSNKVVCLENDRVAGNAVGSQVPPVKIAERTDGAVNDRSLGQRQVPQMASLITVSTASGQLRAPNAIDCESITEISENFNPKIAQGNNDHPSNFMLSDGMNSAGRTSNCQTAKASVDPPFDQPFDIIFGADIVYELSHINLVRGVVERLLRKPSYKPGSHPAYFHLIMPLRPTHADEASSVDMAFPRAEDVVGRGAGTDEVLAIIKSETYARSVGVGRADEVQYVHYCVGWV
ncbi:unnamed protein product [Rhizoctonia solani]|uniref:Methyltransferase domain-containing protein n=1 Tax=Rhizoctonia solani TaxID=456999 RepID=A0A8H3CQA3_9AGAM|nr:unnamed protein product [Rhizoctonia solani]